MSHYQKNYNQITFMKKILSVAFLALFCASGIQAQEEQSNKKPVFTIVKELLH